MKHVLALGLGIAALPLAAFALTPEEVLACRADPAGQGCAEQAARIAACQADLTGDGCGAVLLAHDLAVNWRPEAQRGAEDLAQAERPAEPETEASAEPAAEAGRDTAAQAEPAAPETEATAQGEAEPEAQAAAEPADACPVLASTGWRAATGMAAGGKDRVLAVSGTVTLPTPGWRLELAQGMADRSARPVQHFQLLASPPAGIVAQVLTDYPVEAETPALGAYGGVVIQCEGRVLAEITGIR